MNREQVINSYNQIFELATYYVTAGNELVVKNQEHARELQIETCKKAGEFKRLLRNGEFTWDELQNEVFNKFGYVVPENENINK